MEYQFDNYEIAAVESPVSLHKPILTIKYTHVYVNAELLKSAPDMVYVQFLIDRAAKKMILRPCDKGEKEYVRLRTLNDISAKPRHILSGEFSQRMFEFMQWDIKFRYRLSGTPVITGGVTHIAFNLNDFTKHELTEKGQAAAQRAYESRLGTQTDFGITVEENLLNPLVSHFSEDTTVAVNADGKPLDPDLTEVSDNDNHC